MFDATRALIPAPIKHPLRRMLNGLQSARRVRALARCVTRLRKQVSEDVIDARVLSDLRNAWRNEAYSADACFIGEIASRVQRYQGPFLDCGSGISTLVSGVIASERGTCVWSLEQDEAWYQEMQGILGQLGVANVILWYTPLRRYADFAWFDIDGRRMPAEFSHVFCDGPAVLASEWPDPMHSNWRVGVVPVLQSLGIRFGEILLDDADDPRRSRVCKQWGELGVRTQMVSTETGPFILGLSTPPTSRE